MPPKKTAEERRKDAERVAKAKAEKKRKKKISKSMKGKKRGGYKGQRKKRTKKTIEEELHIPQEVGRRAQAQVVIVGGVRSDAGKRRPKKSWAEKEASRIRGTGLADPAQLRGARAVAQEKLGYSTQSRDPVALSRGAGRYTRDASDPEAGAKQTAPKGRTGSEAVSENEQKNYAHRIAQLERKQNQDIRLGIRLPSGLRTKSRPKPQNLPEDARPDRHPNRLRRGDKPRIITEIIPDPLSQFRVPLPHEEVIPPSELSPAGDPRAQFFSAYGDDPLGEFRIKPDDPRYVAEEVADPLAEFRVAPTPTPAPEPEFHKRSSTDYDPDEQHDIQEDPDELQRRAGLEPVDMLSSAVARDRGQPPPKPSSEFKASMFKLKKDEEKQRIAFQKLKTEKTGEEFHDVQETEPEPAPKKKTGKRGRKQSTAPYTTPTPAPAPAPEPGIKPFSEVLQSYPLKDEGKARKELASMTKKLLKASNQQRALRRKFSDVKARSILDKGLEKRDRDLARDLAQRVISGALSQAQASDNLARLGQRAVAQGNQRYASEELRAEWRKEKAPAPEPEMGRYGGASGRTAFRRSGEELAGLMEERVKLQDANKEHKRRLKSITPKFKGSLNRFNVSSNENVQLAMMRLEEDLDRWSDELSSQEISEIQQLAQDIMANNDRVKTIQNLLRKK